MSHQEKQEIFDEYAEQQKRIAEKATTKTVFTAYGPQQAVEKNSIINPENLIK